MEELETTQIEEQNTVEVEEKQDMETKTFTQEEVNKIVEKRLARERSKLSSLFNDPREVEISKKEKELDIKETNIEMQKHLINNQKSLDLMKLIDCSNGMEKAMESLETIENIINELALKQIDEKIKGGEPMKKAPQGSIDSLDQEDQEDKKIRKAMGL